MTTTDDRPVARTVHDLPDPRVGWSSRAACGDVDPAVFLTARSGSARPEARAICSGCPVRRDCLVSTVRAGDTGVVRAGMNDAERRVWQKRHGLIRTPTSSPTSQRSRKP